ncbi:hypothetical protein ACF08N_11290, partial [Streptomyces sp. NPDC015127]
MGIRSLLRKVFGRDRADGAGREESAATSVPAQTERTEPAKATVPAQSPVDRAAELVSAAFDNPTPRFPTQPKPTPSSVREPAAPAEPAATESLGTEPEAAAPAAAASAETPEVEPLAAEDTAPD